ncbi:DUF3046 domain-containing protein [Rathayibacter iranicus]|uniref:DUF3046 domain-containing protein n=2 Tax=Rathayibacter iranicus TaxID=59737 RepID=A0AAD2JFZ9_9MICO|nr:DUF3046 domain-containing protein [Rathayibacter iranicus]AZZ54743.1 DUF3046 domain-containing protein [Rathayibacter iranicus]MWV30535.1 DUF3046 domain-containing protein [Rathayibacter iranicus NCPPB 2253 = VKM Ac-1602]PPI51000.1 DUF3046 domain-containing protein [Rathayibacter iranicus]PPI62940.1 DUF3046 domain-containing protein [Rathayibacter iranicus]PPI74232.1 DUF3046 domain-containing protein [Rathayibacter iranicus]
MRLSEFRQLVDDEFGGSYARVLVSDLVLTELGGRTAERALSDGAEPREVWFALCRANDVPEARWYGIGPKKRSR